MGANIAGKAALSHSTLTIQHHSDLDPSFRLGSASSKGSLGGKLTSSSSVRPHVDEHIAGTPIPRDSGTAKSMNVQAPSQQQPPPLFQFTPGESYILKEGPDRKGPTDRETSWTPESEAWTPKSGSPASLASSSSEVDTLYPRSPTNTRDSVYRDTLDLLGGVAEYEWRGQKELSWGDALQNARGDTPNPAGVARWTSDLRRHERLANPPPYRPRQGVCTRGSGKHLSTKSEILTEALAVSIGPRTPAGFSSPEVFHFPPPPSEPVFRSSVGNVETTPVVQVNVNRNREIVFNAHDHRQNSDRRWDESDFGLSKESPFPEFCSIESKKDVFEWLLVVWLIAMRPIGILIAFEAHSEIPTDVLRDYNQHFPHFNGQTMDISYAAFLAASMCSVMVLLGPRVMPRVLTASLTTSLILTSFFAFCNILHVFIRQTCTPQILTWILTDLVTSGLLLARLLTNFTGQNFIKRRAAAGVLLGIVVRATLIFGFKTPPS